MSTVTSHRPTFRWQLPPYVGDVTIDLCSDRQCLMPIGAPIHVVGSSYRPTSDLTSGIIYWRLRAATTSFAPSPVWEVFVGPGSASVDTSSGTTLDLNGDGFADVSIAKYDDATVSGQGEVFVAESGIDGPASIYSVTLVGPVGYSLFGIPASAGDLNGDGYGDLAVGVRAQPGEPGPGFVNIYLGGPSGIAATPDVVLSSPDGLGAGFGSSVSGAGDMNGDGYGDLLVGGGVAHLYFGGPSGPSSVVEAISSRPTSSTSAGDVDGDGFDDALIVVSGSGTPEVVYGAASGIGVRQTLLSLTYSPSVMTTGDVNGDGYSDVITGDQNSGVHVFLGSAGGIATMSSTTLSPEDGAQFGFAASLASMDVNADGYSDVLIGDIGRAPGNVYVFYGSSSGIDANTKQTVTPNTTFNPPVTQFGRVMAVAGDVSNSGFPSVIIGTNSNYVFGAQGSFIGLNANVIGNGPPVFAQDAGLFGAAVARFPLGGLPTKGRRHLVHDRTTELRHAQNGIARSIDHG